MPAVVRRAVLFTSSMRLLPRRWCAVGAAWQLISRKPDLFHCGTTPVPVVLAFDGQDVIEADDGFTICIRRNAKSMRATMPDTVR